ncbi:hypothetical protein F2981_32905 (plasmid) [Sinorhizobium meliloti]|nr:hypothetical protein [Sinorhizobium meliloti]
MPIGFPVRPVRLSVQPGQTMPAAAALDLDDGHRLGAGHPGAAVIPTALAIASETDASLKTPFVQSS